MSCKSIVLDADVIIHFSKGDLLNILPRIFAEHRFVILEPVYKEIKNPIKLQLDNQIQYFKNIAVINYSPKGEELREFAILLRDKGKGESACLAFCRFNKNVIGSSNLKDIKQYCNQHNIEYLTTLDFLFNAIKRGLISVAEANKFIQDVIAKDSKLPNIKMEDYVGRIIL